jgi:hypothetical protein
MDAAAKAIFGVGIIVRKRTMQAAYALTRLVLFGFGWGIAAVLALAAEQMLPGVKWPVLGVLAALWTFVCALYVAGEANRGGAASSASPLPMTVADHDPCLSRASTFNPP